MRKTYEDIEEMQDTRGLYTVYEDEDSQTPKPYDLVIAIFDSLEEAAYFREQEQKNRNEELHIAKYDSYMN